MPSVSRHITRAAAPRRLRPAAGRRGPGRLRDDAGHRGAQAGRIQAHPRGARAPPAGQEARPRRTTRGARSDDSSVEHRRPQRQRQYEPCEECGAPLDPQQRYCVNCAARRGNGANPSSRYFAAMSKRARRPPLRAPAKSGSSSRAAAVGFFALLPIAVAIGVVVGRSGNDSGENEALLEALRNQARGRGQHRRRRDERPRPTPPKAKQSQDRPPRPRARAAAKCVAKTSNGDGPRR